MFVHDSSKAHGRNFEILVDAEHLLSTNLKSCLLIQDGNHTGQLNRHFKLWQN